MSKYAEVVKVYNEDIYINTQTGEGIDLVLNKIDPLLSGMASKTYIQGYDYNDIKQELRVLVIEGVHAYEPNKNVKLSTFLQIHLKNKMISKLRSENKKSKDSFYINIENNSDAKIKRVAECISENTEITSGFKLKDAYDKEHSFLEILSNNKFDYNDIDFEISLKNILEKIDSKTAKIFRLVYYEGYTMKEAGEEVGLCGWATRLRLKNLFNKGYFKELLDN